MNKKELHPRQVLAKLSTDPVIENLERLRTDRYVRQNFVVEHQSDKRFNVKRLVPVACATLGLLLIVPSATSVFAEPIQKQLGESLPIAPSQIETDQSPIQQPEESQKDFQLDQELKKVEKKTEHVGLPSEDFQPHSEPVKHSNDQTVDDDVNGVGGNQDQKPDHTEPFPQTNKPSTPVTIVKPHQDHSNARHEKVEAPSIHQTVPAHQVIATKAKPVSKPADSQETIVSDEKQTTDSQVLEPPINKDLPSALPSEESTPTTKDNTPLPKTAGTAPANALSGLGIALLGLAWKLRKYGKAH